MPKNKPKEPPLCALSLISCEWADPKKTLGKIVYDVGGGPPVTRLITESYMRQILTEFTRLLLEKDGNVVSLRGRA